MIAALNISRAFDAPAGHALAAVSLAAWQDPAGLDAAPSADTSFLLMLLQTFLALAFVCGLAYVIFRWLLPRLATAHTSGGMVRVVERTPLDARKSLFVVEVAGRWLLVASSESGVQLVSELDAERAEEAAREAEVKRPTFGSDAAAVRGAFARRLARVMNRKGGAP